MDLTMIKYEFLNLLRGGCGDVCMKYRSIILALFLFVLAAIIATHTTEPNFTDFIIGNITGAILVLTIIQAYSRK